jgi:hypothetical protein
MNQKQLWTTVAITAVVAVIVSLIMSSFVSPQLAPASSARPSSLAGEINAHRCDADGVCEVNALIVTDDAEFEDSLRANLDLIAEGKLTVKDNLYVASNELFTFWEGPTGNLYIENDLVVGDDIGSLSMTGNGTAYACISSGGEIFRSSTPCV